MLRAAERSPIARSCEMKDVNRIRCDEERSAESDIINMQSKEKGGRVEKSVLVGRQDVGWRGRVDVWTGQGPECTRCFVFGLRPKQKQHRKANPDYSA